MRATVLRVVCGWFLRELNPEPERYGLVSRNGRPLPPPGPEPSPPVPFLALPPSLLGTVDPAHLGLPESLASVTVPIRLDALSCLLHSALLGACALQQAWPTCPCSGACWSPAGQAASPSRVWGAREMRSRPGRGRGQRRWGPWRAEPPERGWAGGAGHSARPPALAPPTQGGEQGAPGPGPTVDMPPAAEDWESEY
ncbi:PREDICTED: uncharacterized protein C19orf84 homolog [Condylura cristata]|uniref:uncharacterized protein C19orf84 homolog n=1 Tax=Condylura cristata TaxID=143302 RepID=UPI0006428912|nr:PREDICTED: uncharacterized protein C19orf84 homolog [Condylura cristata]